MDIILKAEKYAKERHKKMNQKYGHHPYSYHLDLVAELFDKYKQVLVNPTDRINTHAACYCHDLIEDAQQTYNDVFKETNRDIADIVFAVTDVPAKNRLLRSLNTLPKTIQDYRAIILKICDISVNAEFSKNNSGGMFKKYQEEAQYKKYIFQKALKWYPIEIDHSILLELWDHFNDSHVIFI